jgi:tRNA (guanine-N7-)-methyltransferase
MEIDFSLYPQPKRFRHHIASNVYFPANEFSLEQSYYPPLYEKIDWDSKFANGKAPDMLDIGCAFGKFTLKTALMFENKNVLGIEVRSQPLEWINNIIEKEKLKNVATLNYSVVNGMPFLENESIETIFYFYPDPWFKKKHHKRRAFNQAFLEECHRVMKSDGIFMVQTDIIEKHEYNLSELEKFAKFDYKLIEDRKDWALNGQILAETDQEEFINRKGLPTYRLICTKK